MLSNYRGCKYELIITFLQKLSNEKIVVTNADSGILK